MPPDIASAYAESQNEDQELVLNLALFLSNFLREHLKLVENEQNKELLLNAHLYLVKISQVEEREVFKICLEYWAKLVSELYAECQAVSHFRGLHARQSRLIPCHRSPARISTLC